MGRRPSASQAIDPVSGRRDSRGARRNSARRALCVARAASIVGLCAPFWHKKSAARAKRRSSSCPGSTMTRKPRCRVERGDSALVPCRHAVRVAHDALRRRRGPVMGRISGVCRAHGHGVAGAGRTLSARSGARDCPSNGRRSHRMRGGRPDTRRYCPLATGARPVGHGAVAQSRFARRAAGWLR